MNYFSNNRESIWGYGYQNPYYKTDHDLYNVPESQFLDYLAREGATVSDYWTHENYNCFFRRNKDTNQTNDNISIYYPIDTNMHPGSLINHYGNTYLILNQESLENRVYHRSDGLNADVMLNTYNSDTMQDISLPCFAYDLTGTTPETSDIMSTINGSVELMTGDNEVSRQLKVNCEFYAMGNWYTIVSVNFKTGIARIGATIIQSPSTPIVYELSINAESTYNQGDATTLTASATADESPVSNATLVWSSSNSEIVDITEDGHAMFVGEGTCAISCYWEEHNITDTVYVEVIVEPEISYVCEIDGVSSMNTGASKTFTAKFYQTDGVTEDTTIVPVWSLDVPSSIKNSVTITGQSGKTITIKVSSGSGAVGQSFGINLSDSDGLYHTTKTVRITSWL